MWQRTASACRGPSNMPRREQSGHTDTGMASGQAVTLRKDDGQYNGGQSGQGFIKTCSCDTCLEIS